MLSEARRMEEKAKARKTRVRSAPSLQKGGLVEVRSEREIMDTLDENRKNNGLEFMPEMAKYCGGRYRIYKRLEKIILEGTGQFRHIKNTVLLEGVICDGSEHMGCDRSCFHYWREAWLKKVD